MATAVHATRADVPAVIDAVIDAFRDDPVQRWVFRGADLDAGLRALFTHLVEGYFAVGHAYLVSDPGGVVGAGLWEPPDRSSLPEERIAELLADLAPILGDHLGAVMGELARTYEYRPAEPHLYLGILGVVSRAQSGGFGTALIAPVLAECDRMGMLAHLESSNPRNVPFYLRHGFEVVDAFHCGGDGPVMTIMTRQPRP